MSCSYILVLLSAIIDRHTATSIHREERPSLWNPVAYQQRFGVSRLAQRDSVAAEIPFDDEQYIFSFDEDLDVTASSVHEKGLPSDEDSAVEFRFSDAEITPRESDLRLDHVKGCQVSVGTSRSSDCSEPESLDGSFDRRMSPSIRRIMEDWNESGREVVDDESGTLSSSPVMSSNSLIREELERLRTIRVPDWAMKITPSPPEIPQYFKVARSPEQHSTAHANALSHKGNINGLHVRSIPGARDYLSDNENSK
jgi:hypothetical protein